MTTTSGERVPEIRADTQRASFTEHVGTVVSTRIGKLQHGVVRNQPDSVAALARLRRAVGKPPGSMLEILQYTLAPEFAGPDADDNPTPAETAAHLSMTLYAVHQQAVTDRMHRSGRQFGLGRSARRLITDQAFPERPHPVVRRFQALGTSSSLDELTHHARGLVQQLRAQRIPLDYGLLAQQLLRWQRPGGPEHVRLLWGRDFFVRPALNNPDPDNTGSAPSSES
jgi:CRISPR system Cascade subunit CasB